jgi:hypothetical protein
MKSKRQVKKRNLRKSRKRGGAWWNVLKNKTEEGEKIDERGVNKNKTCMEEIKDWENWKNEINPDTGKVYEFDSEFTYPSLASKILYGRIPRRATEVGINLHSERVCSLPGTQIKKFSRSLLQPKIIRTDIKNPGFTFQEKTQFEPIRE